MRKKHSATLKAIFHQPVLSSVKWADVEALFVALGAEIEEARGSRVRILLNNQVAVFHRPHPRKETDKGALRGVFKCRLRRFLGLFWTIFHSFCGGSIRSLIQPPQKEWKSRLKRTQKSTEAEFEDAP